MILLCYTPRFYLLKKRLLTLEIHFAFTMSLYAKHLLVEIVEKLFSYNSISHFSESSVPKS